MIEAVLQYCNCVVIVITLVTVVLLFFLPRRPNGIPPGPRVFPIIGNIPSILSRDPIYRFAKLRSTYGDIYGVYIGRELTVVLNGYDVIHDALVKKGDTFSKRPRSEFHQLMFKEPGIVYTNGRPWKENRKFVQLALNEFGCGWTEKTMEDRINEEIQFFIQRIETYENPFDISGIITLSVANVIADMLFGERSEYDDPKFITCIHSVGETAKLFAISGLLMSCLPFLQDMPGDLLNLDKIDKLRQKPRDFMNVMCSRHSITCESERTRTVLDMYRKEMARNHDNGKLFTELHMRVLMGELLSAGSETTATTILWLVLYLIRNPDIQTRLQVNIDEIVGRERQPTLADKSKLPYVEATILEVLRIAPVAPLSVPHAVHEDVTFRGYNIPKESTIFVNLHSVLKDPEIWSDPDCFRPERFINEDGCVSIPKEFIPFSIGRRGCLGESLARMELFLYTTTMLQRFEFSSSEPGRMPSTDGRLGLTYSPYPFTVRATVR